MIQETFMQRIEASVIRRAEKQAAREEQAFQEELVKLLTRHGILESEAKWRLGPAMSKAYREERSLRLRQEMEFEVAQRILGEEAGGTQKV